MINKAIIAVILAGFGAQLVKLVVLWFRHKRLTWHDLVVTGGMPSSHSAFVVALATIIYLQEGTSSAFAISLVLALIVLRDAFGVRRSVGMEGKAIQKLFQMHHLRSKFHYSLGHSPREVIVGSLIGFAVALIVHLCL
ncbi:divergent PAP2 family protein [Candidatus Woesearchaeota archaeon]|nr:divergent PAP2 family protein [Candidatus Woesearchaeota archaeon]